MTQWWWLTLVLLTVAVATSATANADSRTDIPSCRTYLPALQKQPPGRSLYVIIDRTTVLDTKVRENVVTRLERAIRPNDRIAIVGFSSYQGKQHIQLLFDGRLNRKPSKQESYDLSKRAVEKYQHCIGAQFNYARHAVSKALSNILKAPLKKAQHSEILGSLSLISNELVKPGAAKQKIVLIVSDMLEYSAGISFYAHSQMRKIKPDRVLKRVKAKSLFGAFDDASIYVAGAAIMAGESAGYRPTSELRALKQFWTMWFTQSDGKLAAWGQPVLLKDIR